MMTTTVREVIVVGGGISGLTVSWHLKKAGVDGCLLEAEPQVGGCAQTRRRDGFLIEKGPFNVIVREPAFESLLEDVAADARVIAAAPSAGRRYVYHCGRLHRVPDNPLALLTTGLLGFGARWRLIRGLMYSARAGEMEETIAQAASRRFGAEAANTLISAAVSGIYAGDIHKLGLRSCFPTISGIDAQARSLIGFGLRKALGRKEGKKKHRRRWRGLVSLEGGLGALTEALGRRLGEDRITRCRVESIERDDRRFVLKCRINGTELRTYRCHQLVMAGSAPSAGKLLIDLAPQAAKLIESIESSPLVVLNLGYRREQIGHPLDGFGFLVPQDEPGFPLMGVLWADSIFPHHAPPDRRLLRVFLGGARDPRAVTQSDDELLRTTQDALRDLLSIKGDPVLVDFHRYRAAIPQYTVGHHDKVDRIREAAGRIPGLHLVGNYLNGVSLNDCVRVGTECARSVAAALRRDDTASRSQIPSSDGASTIAVSPSPDMLCG